MSIIHVFNSLLEEVIAGLEIQSRDLPKLSHLKQILLIIFSFKNRKKILNQDVRIVHINYNSSKPTGNGCMITLLFSHKSVSLLHAQVKLLISLYKFSTECLHLTSVIQFSSAFFKYLYIQFIRDGWIDIYFVYFPIIYS